MNESDICYNECAANWPPFLVNGCNGSAVIQFAGDVNSTFLGAFARNDSTVQLTYNNMLLYSYIKDSAPGEISGENQITLWGSFFLVSSAGLPINTTNAADMTMATS